MTALEERRADATCAKITKELFLESIVCPARGWRLRHNGHREVPSAGDRMRMAEGQAVHRRARSLYPDGIFAAIKGDSISRTNRLLMDRSKPVLFEAAILAGPFTARADILLRTAEGWELIEIKSNVILEDDLLHDLAFTLMVLKRAGVKVVKASLMLLAADYRLGMPLERLFRTVDCTTNAMAWADRFDRIADALHAATSAPTCPSAPLTRTCRDCPSYRADCHGAGIEHDILELPRISNWRVKALADARVVRIADIPATPGLLTPTQATVRSAVIAGRAAVDPRQLRALLDQIKWPAGFLDFESLQLAIPIYPNVRPFEMIPTQYSLDICKDAGGITRHREYLADPRRDCRQELARRLCDDLEGVRTIVSFSGYEKRVLTELAALCDDERERLDACAERLFDLERCVRPGVYYHPSFKGRSSLKYVMPALVPGLRYDDLAIGDGDSAVAAFARMAWGQCSEQEIQETRRALMVYCARDTESMVRVYQALARCC